jgi:hypothetical protein
MDDWFYSVEVRGWEYLCHKMKMENLHACSLRITDGNRQAKGFITRKHNIVMVNYNRVIGILIKLPGVI